jgi:hypothetical protein
MRHAFRLLSLLLLLALGVPGVAAVRAQDATPPADMSAPEGVTFTPLGVAPGVALPSPVDLTVARMTLAPGAGFPLEPSDPEGALLVMEAGAMTIRVADVGWAISRGAAMQQAMATPSAEPTIAGVLEQVAMGTEATLRAGDMAYVPGSIAGEVRNDGAEPATALLVLTDPPGTLLGQGTPEATPAP